jgi:hypothetical protein
MPGDAERHQLANTVAKTAFTVAIKVASARLKQHGERVEESGQEIGGSLLRAVAAYLEARSRRAAADMRLATRRGMTQEAVNIALWEAAISGALAAEEWRERRATH